MVYSIFGLTISTNMPVPGLTPSPVGSPSAVDIQVKLGFAGPPEILATPTESRYEAPEREANGQTVFAALSLAQGTYFRLLYGDGTSFLLNREGTKIWGEWQPPLTLEDTTTYLLGPVLTFALRLRGAISLHASAIRVGDAVIALMGPAGSGKSTTAAAFAKMGYGVLTDDAATLAETEGRFLVYSGYPLVRLWKDSAVQLFGSAEALPLLTPNWEKRYLDLRGVGYRFESQPLPLAAIYELGDRARSDTAPMIEPLAGSAAFMALVGNTSSNHLLDARMRAHELGQLTKLANSIPVRRATPHADPHTLGRLCEAILTDFECLVPLSDRPAAAQLFDV